MSHIVWVRSKPGFFAQYDGKVEVDDASSKEEAVDRAFRKLRLGAFPDRPRSMWIVERVEEGRS